MTVGDLKAQLDAIHDDSLEVVVVSPLGEFYGIYETTGENVQKLEAFPRPDTARAGEVKFYANPGSGDLTAQMVVAIPYG